MALHTGYTPAGAVNSSDHTVHALAVVVRHMDSDFAAVGSNSALVPTVDCSRSPGVVESHSCLDCVAGMGSGNSRSVVGIGWGIAGSGLVACSPCGAALACQYARGYS